MTSHTPSRLVGLIGSGIGGSLSPALHEAEARAQGIGYAYRVLDIDTLGVRPEDAPEVLESARRLGFDGLNVTHPCKQTVLPALDALSPQAAAIGAVNTVVLDGGRAVGHNTDTTGFAAGLTRALPDARLDRVVLLGAGGAGAAVGHAALSLGAGRLTVVDVAQDRAEALADRLRAHFGTERVLTAPRTDLDARLAAADGLLHATPTGMVGHPGCPLDPAALHPGLWVADVVYRPLETALLRHAQRAGCPVVGGGGMAVFQAVHAFELFTGATPDAERMLRHFARLTANGNPEEQAGGRAPHATDPHHTTGAATTAA
ncbi:shikimate dehydrogenase [Streptomyces sp. NPDC059740]|uniref:shikimate dehydrogenase n=1 Tax=Streptomyces sp. NPDC059740 TaxID=3346926 RepID=UPI00365FA9D0